MTLAPTPRLLAFLLAVAMSGSIEDLEFFEGEVVTAPTTSTGHKILWQCCVGRWEAHDVVSRCDYNSGQQVALEAAFQAKVDEVPLTSPGNDTDVWVVHFGRMTQTNPATGTVREIRRIVVLKG